MESWKNIYILKLNSYTNTHFSALQHACSKLNIEEIGENEKKKTSINIPDVTREM